MKKIFIFILLILGLLTPVSAALSDNIEAYWTLDNVLTDATGNGYIMGNNGATYTSSGKINGAYEFDAINDYMSIPTSIDLASDNTFTISFWIKQDGGAVGDVILDSRTTGGGYIYMDDTAGSGFRIIIGSSGSLEASDFIGSDWKMITIVKEGTGTNELKLYVNGVLDIQGTDASTLPSNIGLVIGSRYSFSNYFDGAIDEPSIWKRGLTQSEITLLYNSNIGFQYPFTLEWYDDISFTNEEFVNSAVSETVTKELSNGKLAVGYIVSGSSNSNLKICDIDGTNCVLKAGDGLAGTLTSIDLFENTDTDISYLISTTAGIYLIRYDIDGNKLGGATAIVVGSADYVSAVQTTSTDFAMNYRDVADSDKSQIIICKLDSSSCGSEINQGSPSSHLNMIKTSDDHLAIVGNVGGNGLLRITSLTGSVISSFIYNSGGSDNSKIMESSDNKFKIIYRDSANNNIGTLISCNLDASSISDCGSEIEILQSSNTGSSVSPSGITEFNEKLFMTYRDDFTGKFELKNCELDGSTISQISILSSSSTSGQSAPIITSENTLIAAYGDSTTSKGMFAISELLAELAIKDLEQLFTQEQIGIITLTNNNYVQILGGSFNTTLDTTTLYDSLTLALLSNESNELSCHSVFDGTNSSETIRSNINGIIGNMAIMHDAINVSNGSHTIALQCKMIGSGQIQIGFAKGVAHILNTINNDSINYLFGDVTETITSGLFYSEISNMNLTTTNRTGLDKSIVIEWVGEIINQHTSTEDINLKFTITDGITSHTCKEIKRTIQSGNTASVGGICSVSSLINDTVYNIKLEGTGTDTDYIISGFAKEFNTEIDEVKNIELDTEIFNGNDQVIKSFTIENTEDNGYLYLRYGSTVTSDLNAIVSTYYHITATGYDENTTTMLRTFNTDYGVMIKDDVISVPKGTLTIELKSSCDVSSANCEFVSGDMTAYITNKLDLISNAISLQAYNQWNASQILEYQVISGGVIYNTTNGNISILTDESYIDLSFSTNDYLPHAYTAIDTSINFNGSLYQSILTLNTKEILTNNTINNFSVDTIEGLFNTTNGILTLYPNLGNYSFDFLFNNYYNKTNINISISSSSESYILNDVYDTILNFKDAITSLNLIPNCEWNNFNISSPYHLAISLTSLNLLDCNLFSYNDFSTNLNKTSLPQNLTFNLDATTLAVKVYDLNNPTTQLNFSIIIENSTDVIEFTNQLNFEKNYTQIPTGDIKMIISSLGFEKGFLYNTLTDETSLNLNAYLSSNTTAELLTFQTLDFTSGELIENVDVEVQTIINGSYVTIQQSVTSISGYVYFLLDITHDYKYIFSKDGYTQATITSIPGVLIYTVRLKQDSSIFTYLDDVSYYFSPDGSSLYSNATYNLSVFVSGSSITLMQFKVYEDDILINEQTSTNPTGTTFNYNYFASDGIGVIKTDLVYFINEKENHISRSYNILSMNEAEIKELLNFGLDSSEEAKLWRLFIILTVFAGTIISARNFAATRDYVSGVLIIPILFFMFIGWIGILYSTILLIVVVVMFIGGNKK